MKALVLFTSLSVLLVTNGDVFAQQWEKLTKTADSLVEKGQYQSAYEQYQTALTQAEVEFGKSHINYAKTLLNIGSTLESLSQYSDAEKIIKQAIVLVTNLTGPESSDLAEALYVLGIVYRSKSQYSEAEPLLVRSMEIRRKIFGEESEDYLTSLNSLGAMYLMARNSTKAEPVLLESLLLQQKRGNKRQSGYATALNNLAVLYMYIDDYVRAEPFMAEVIQIRKETLGERHPTYAVNLNNLAKIYSGLGDYARAISLYNQVLKLIETSNPTSSLYQIALNNLAEVYRETKQYKQSEALYKQALTVIDQRLGHDHIEYGTCLGNLALLYDEMGNSADSQPLFEEALSVIRRKTGTESALYTNLLNNMALADNRLGNYRRADSLITEAIKTTVRTQGKANTRFVNYKVNQAMFSFTEKRLDRAVNALDECVAVLNNELVSNFLYLPARQKQTYLNRWKSIYGSLFSVTIQQPDDSSMADRAYNSNLFLKNLLLNEQTNLSAVLSRSGNPAVKAALDSLTTVKNGLSVQYAKPVAQRQGVDSLENRAERLEKQLARQSADFRKAQQALQLRWQDVRDALKPGDAAVEFVSFPYHNGRKMTDSTVYMALVLRSGDTHPSLVPLCNEGQLNQLLHQKPTDGQTFAATLYRSFDSSIDPDQLSKADSLYALVWQPIDQLLQHVRRVYVAPAGRLHQLAFAALPYRNQQTKAAGTSPKTDRYLSDRYELRLVGSTRSVAIPAPEVPYRSLTSARLYGGIQYDADSTTLLKNRDTTLVARRSDPLRGLTRGNTWEFLAGSQREIEQVGRVLGKRATALTGSRATEESLKALSGQSPAVLHVATHGFFFPDARQTGDNVFRASADPLLRSGVVLAGANHIWRGGKPVPGVEDGILTAYEVANLNLTGTQVVALSACETGLGDIQGSEGVFGLQRAFKMAGVNYVLMSLWQVADQPTSVFMETFYRNWKKHQTIRTAFSKTQQQMRRRYPPAVWAAFVLLE